MTVIAVAGAGTMGAGIAQVAAVAGHPVLVYDAVPGAAEAAIGKVRERVARRGQDPDALKLRRAGSIAELAAAAVVVEAIAEDLTVKRRLFADLEQAVTGECVLATNTSSLSPTAIAAGLRHPERVVGLHFFNPVPAMKLVEVIPGLATGAEVTAAAAALARSWGKTVVRASATPGFIVNRVARPFYGEAWRLYEEGVADAATIDAVLTGAGGFRMGPFALMDLIGHDVNEAVTRSVWTAFGHDPRYTPSLAQRALTDAGWLGRKTGRGVYDYAGAGPAPARATPTTPAEARPAPAGAGLGGLAGAGLDELADAGLAGVGQADAGLGGLDERGVALPGGATLLRSTGTMAAELAARTATPVIVADRVLDDATATAIAIAASPGCPEQAVSAATGLLQAAGLDVYLVGDAPGLIVTRTVAMLVNAAFDALQHQVASADDIDTAMRLGTNYPIGPIAWGQRWGLPAVLGILDNLLRAEGNPRYRASTLLRREAASAASVATLVSERPG